MSADDRFSTSVPVLSPHPSQPSKRRPRWWERLRGLLGMSAIVIVTGAVMAITFAGILLALAIFIATIFN